MTTRELEHPENGRISANAPKVSVIVPVFNPGPDFDRCLESLRGQTLADIEMIFVDDCGTDGAMEQVRAAAGEDPRIRIIANPENLGPGLSRNAGIEAARGEYISFVDADDHISPDFLELLHDKAVADRIIPSRPDHEVGRALRQGPQLPGRRFSAARVPRRANFRHRGARDLSLCVPNVVGREHVHSPAAAEPARESP